MEDLIELVKTSYEKWKRQAEIEFDLSNKPYLAFSLAIRGLGETSASVAWMVNFRDAFMGEEVTKISFGYRTSRAIDEERPGQGSFGDSAHSVNTLPQDAASSAAGRDSSLPMIGSVQTTTISIDSQDRFLDAWIIDPSEIGFATELHVTLQIAEASDGCTLGVISREEEAARPAEQSKKARAECRTIKLDCLNGCHLQKNCSTGIGPIYSSCNGCYIDCQTC